MRPKGPWVATEMSFYRYTHIPSPPSMVVIVGPVSPRQRAGLLISFSPVRRNKKTKKQKKRKHSVRPAPEPLPPSLSSDTDSNSASAPLSPLPQSPGPQEACLPVLRAAAPRILRGGEGDFHPNFGLTSLSLGPTRCGRGLA